MIFRGCIVSNVEHVFNVLLRLILGLMLVCLLLVRQLDRTSSIKELGGAIGRHILELSIVKGCRARLTTVTDTA